MVVIPGIEGADAESVKEQYEKVKDLNPEGWVHLDITDGKFSPAVNWGSPAELSSLVASRKSLSTKFELHLMVEEVEKVLDGWLKTGLVKRVIVHLEAMTDPVFVAAKCKEYGVEPMLSIKPETEVEGLFAHKDDFRSFQVLAVAPGWAGQKFGEEALKKIAWIREKIPNAIIEIDGGINPETARKCFEAGGSVLVSTSYIQNSPDPKEAYNSLVVSR
ncbi:MAG: hypothetical protein Q7S83_03870 [bacterium]|nr:hypothetical protein [bacterium]